ncbi:BspA family leucine-rich repeat surface protein [Flagellimonas sp.]|uniref:BspA family leucine-rich repeat surface protein n=1 Tax=Flagellimonas sp. TaxID=2058762 RepID=UPI003F4A42A2
MKVLLRQGLPVVMAILLFTGCSKDDGPANSVPTINAQIFDAAENIIDTAPIGTIVASDSDGDDISFTLDTNSDNLFEVNSESGVLSLAAGKQLNFAAKPQHTLKVSVSDGISSNTATITVNVLEVTIENLAPIILEDVSEIIVFENITDEDVIVSIVAEDPEGENLTFEITTNDNDLFVINNDGDLGLADMGSLDFETVKTHNIVVTVSDGVNPVVVPITISVGDVAEAQANDISAFVTTWQVVDASKPIDIGLNSDYNYNFTINWGDGILEKITQEGTQNIEHQYTDSGSYTISIIGEFPSIFMTVSSSQTNISRIDQWGTIQWQSMNAAFDGCQNLEYGATDVPNLMQVTDSSLMFKNCTAFNGNLANWDTQNLSKMSSMFEDASSFDQNLGAWDISSVTDMSNMLDDSNLSKTNYQETLIGWAFLNTDIGESQIPENVTLGALGLTYCNGTEGENAKNVLINDYGWTITDGGGDICF